MIFELSLSKVGGSRAETETGIVGGRGTAGKFIGARGSVDAVVGGLAWPANTSPHMPSKDTNHVNGDALKASQCVLTFSTVNP